MLRQAVNWGVTYWDTAHSYRWGKSEKGIGKYFEKYPGDRKKIFLVTKSGAWTKSGMTKDLEELLRALKEALDRADLFVHHAVTREPLSVRERMSSILDQLRDQDYLPFQRLFEPEEGRIGVVVAFLAILELIKGALVEVVQNEPLGPIYLKPAE